MKAITTKYYGPTDRKASRIVASDIDGNKVTMSYDSALTNEGAHERVAQALCNKMNWTGRLIGGGVKDGYVFVFEPVATPAIRDSLGHLLQHVMGNRGDRSRNPYSIPEFKAALQAMYFERTGRQGEFDDYASAADGYRVNS